MIALTDERPAGTLAAVLRRPWRELELSWRFVRNDIWAGTLPGIAFTAVALRHEHASPTAWVAGLAASALYFWLYLYGHTLANQIVGIDEDRINKPNRPLPSGRVTLAGARSRLYVVSALVCLVGGAFGVGRWAALWVVTYFLLNFHGHRHWFLKNSLPMATGALAMLCAAYEIVAPLPSFGWQVVLGVAAFVFLTSPIQDFRDVEGDRVLGRRTLPIAFGERPARLVIAAALIGWLPVAYFALVRPAGGGLLSGLFAGLLAVLELHVAVRLLRYRGPVEDHRTYRLYEQLYCLYVVAGLGFLS